MEEALAVPALCANFILSYAKKMTVNKRRPIMSFGEFYALCRSLWTICHVLDDLQNENNNQVIIENLRQDKYHVITELCDEYKKWNYSLDEFYWCVVQINRNNQTRNPYDFHWERHAYKIHISNCFLLNQTI